MEIGGRETQQASKHSIRQTSRPLDGIRKQNEENGAKLYSHSELDTRVPGPGCYVFWSLAYQLPETADKKDKGNLAESEMLYKLW